MRPRSDGTTPWPRYDDQNQCTRSVSSSHVCSTMHHGSIATYASSAVSSTHKDLAERPSLFRNVFFNNTSYQVSVILEAMSFTNAQLVPRRKFGFIGSYVLWPI
jgi:hypothetical protein